MPKLPTPQSTHPKIKTKTLASSASTSYIATSATSLKKIKITSDNKCDLCLQSKCCRYATERLTTPRSMKDFDTLLWQVSHKSVHIYQDDYGWFLQIMADCEHLQDNGLCGIYETRPIVCREHDNEHCDFDIPLDGETIHYFTNYQQLNEFCKKRFKSWEKRF